MISKMFFIDEASIELRDTAYKRWHKDSSIEIHRGKIGKHTHSAKIHVWTGIPRRRPTPVIAFSGSMDSKGFQKITKVGFCPFVGAICWRRFPSGHRLYIDNDPKHKIRSTLRFLSALESIILSHLPSLLTLIPSRWSGMTLNSFYALFINLPIEAILLKVF